MISFFKTKYLSVLRWALEEIKVDLLIQNTSLASKHTRFTIYFKIQLCDCFERNYKL